MNIINEKHIPLTSKEPPIIYVIIESSLESVESSLESVESVVVEGLVKSIVGF
jgi:hypothetical protein